MMKRILVVAMLLVCAVPVQAEVTEETVGDPYSFGRNQTYLGLAQVRVTLRADCSEFPPDADPCIELTPAPGVTNVDESDLAAIELPGNATNSLICFTFTPFATWEWLNNTGSTQTASMFLRPTVRVESEVLADPSLINPVTGMPFNGVLIDQPISTFLQSRSLAPGESDFQFRATTRACTGGLASQRMLGGLGLSDKLIKEFFKEPIFISFGVSGSVSMVTSGGYLVGIRLYGD